MTKMKFCGLTRGSDIVTANLLRPDYIGFVFWEKSKRFLPPEEAEKLRKILDPHIPAVGVFVDEDPEKVAALLGAGIIDLAQLHGKEDEEYIRRLRSLTDKPLIQAFRIKGESGYKEILKKAQESTADYILLDSGAGTGRVFDWTVLKEVERPFFLAGGLTPENVGDAVEQLHPFAVDVSSGIETKGRKDSVKMAAFAEAVRQSKGGEDRND